MLTGTLCGILTSRCATKSLWNTHIQLFLYKYDYLRVTSITRQFIPLIIFRALIYIYLIPLDKAATNELMNI